MNRLLRLLYILISTKVWWKGDKSIRWISVMIRIKWICTSNACIIAIFVVSETLNIYLTTWEPDPTGIQTRVNGCKDEYVIYSTMVTTVSNSTPAMGKTWVINLILHFSTFRSNSTFARNLLTINYKYQS